jgi:hypothetical protein
MQSRTFTAVIARAGGSAVVELPFDPADAWEPRGRYGLTGTIGGHGYRGKVETPSVRPALSVGPAWRRDAGVEVGMTVAVEVELELPQIETVAADLASALRAAPEALRAFEAMPTFYRRNYVRWVEEARRPDTRARRIAEAVRMMADGRRM